MHAYRVAAGQVGRTIQRDRGLETVGLGDHAVGAITAIGVAHDRPAPRIDIALGNRVLRRSNQLLMHLPHRIRSEEHTYELQSLMRISYAVFCLKKKNYTQRH